MILNVDLQDPVERAESVSRRRTFRQRWYRTPTFVAGLLILTVMIVSALLAPLLTHYDPNVQDLLNPLANHSGKHWLGTDQLGRDVFARLLYSGRVDLIIGFLAVLFPFLLGATLGLLAGYKGGWIDTVIMRCVDTVVAFPFFVLVIALVFVLGAGGKSIVIAITIVGWISYARIVRGEVLIQKRLDYVLAARAGGLSSKRIMFRHLLPNVITQPIVYAMSDIVQSILAIVTLGYLGLGVPPPTAEWGSMISDGETLLTTQWQIATFPGVAVVLVGLGLSLLGDGLSDLMRPE